MKSVFTIHNLQYQGIYDKETISDFLDIPQRYLDQDKAGFFDQGNFLKAGVVFANAVTTVSETYAQEIQYPYFGENLDNLMREKSFKLSGILNGLDYQLYNPETDKDIYKQYSTKTAVKGKAANKKGLQKELGLDQSKDTPLIAMVTRLTNQKGLDLVDRVMGDILHRDTQFVVLGTGESQYENMFKSYAGKYPSRVSANIFFSEPLAQKIYAGADLFLMPSLFEPCGIGQMIALRYGTIPIVREIGGLKETVESYNDHQHTGNGFSFTNYNAHDMLYTIDRALRFYKDKEHFTTLIENAMSSDFSWEKSAYKYIDLYENL